MNAATSTPSEFLPATPSSSNETPILRWRRVAAAATSSAVLISALPSDQSAVYEVVQHTVHKAARAESVAKSAAYAARLEELNRYADEDGVIVNEGSVDAFKDFVEQSRDFKSASLVLLDSGNVRAVWRRHRERTPQVAAEFKDDGTILYVLSTQDDGVVAKRGSALGFVRAVERSGIGHLLFL